jgi:hypothetical protein
LPDPRYSELSLSAQTAYAELAERTRVFELDSALSGLSGSFHTLTRKNKDYWYFSYRETGVERSRVIYVGPDNAPVRALVEKFRQQRNPKALAPQALAAINLGCSPVVPRHFRLIKRLAEYGLFRAGALLVGTHAFVAYGNLLGVRWRDAAATLDVDFAHAGRNVSLALPSDINVNVHDALQSLEMGLLPITELDGAIGSQYRNPNDAELRVDFLTSKGRSNKPVKIPALNVTLEPLKFMEFALEGATQACVFGRTGACTVNLPAPERYAAHKLVVYGERPISQRTKAAKDLLQTAALAAYFQQSGQATVFNAAWRDLVSRGRGWRSRARQGRDALFKIAPDVELQGLWKE